MTIRRLEQMMLKNMINFRQIRLAGTAFGLLTFISGCATLNAPPKTEVDVSAYSNLTTVDALKKLESNAVSRILGEA